MKINLHEKCRLIGVVNFLEQENHKNKLGMVKHFKFMNYPG